MQVSVLEGEALGGLTWVVLGAANSCAPLAVLTAAVGVLFPVHQGRGAYMKSCSCTSVVELVPTRPRGAPVDQGVGSSLCGVRLINGFCREGLLAVVLVDEGRL